MINRKPRVFIFDGVELFKPIYSLCDRDDLLTKEMYKHSLNYIELILMDNENDQGFRYETGMKFGHRYVVELLVIIERYIALNQFGCRQVIDYITTQREFHDVVLTTSWEDYLEFRITVRSVCPDKEFEELIKKWVRSRKEKNLFVPYAYLEIDNLP